MASALQKLARTAGRTLLNLSKQQQITDKRKLLADEMKNITCDDIPFDRKFLQPTGLFHREPGNPPVIYVQLWEDEVFTMGVFILKHGVRLPLHDHPEMYGFIKVIHGKALVHSYSMDNDAQPTDAASQNIPSKLLYNVKCAEKLPDKVLEPKDATCCLTPKESNVHEIWAVDGPMAFLDILAPPYDHTTGARECHYYQDINEMKHLFPGLTSEGSFRYLLGIDQPHEFWCGTTPYLGKELNPYSDSVDSG